VPVHKPWQARHPCPRLALPGKNKGNTHLVETISAVKVGPKTLFVSRLSSKAADDAAGHNTARGGDEIADKVLQPLSPKLCFNDGIPQTAWRPQCIAP
jgi:hypothetical protein